MCFDFKINTTLFEVYKEKKYGLYMGWTTKVMRFLPNVEFSDLET
jgi:hypothetical protein